MTVMSCANASFNSSDNALGCLARLPCRDVIRFKYDVMKDVYTANKKRQPRAVTTAIAMAKRVPINTPINNITPSLSEITTKAQAMQALIA